MAEVDLLRDGPPVVDQAPTPLTPGVVTKVQDVGLQLDVLVNFSWAVGLAEATAALNVLVPTNTATNSGRYNTCILLVLSL